MCSPQRFHLFFFNDTATTEIYTLSLHDALPISALRHRARNTARLSLPRARLAIAERLPVFGLEARETRDGVRGVPDLCGGRVQRGRHPHHGGARQDARDRHPPRDGAPAGGDSPDFPGAGDLGRAHRNGARCHARPGAGRDVEPGALDSHRSVDLLHRPSPRAHAAARRAARDRRQRGDRHARAVVPGDAGGAARSRERDPLRMTALLEARGVRKVFAGGDGQPLEVLRAVELEVHRGEFVAIVGASGAGKSTLLHLLGALDRPTGGDVWLDGSRYADLDANALAELRNGKLGFVFQFHHLLREFSALENVMMPLLIGGMEQRQARSRAEELLSLVGLAGRMTHRPAELSGGEQQRCAVARALVHDPSLVLADEPSGNLDHANSDRLHEVFFRLAREYETAVVVVTHNRQLAGRADRILMLEDGRLAAVGSVDAIP